MRVFYELEHLPIFRNAVLTIGSFDGVHLGHQQLLARINSLARRCSGESVVVTFHPHPRQVVFPNDKSLKLLTTIDEKITLFERYGVENVVVVPFSVAFSQISADEYIETFLVRYFNPRYIVIGHDHRFGLNRQGDIHFLKWHQKRFGYEVLDIPAEEIDAITVSSTKIRQALEEGNTAQAARLLGHSYPLSGTVVKGKQLGTQLGFPTANLHVSEKAKLIPPDGIYAVYANYNGERLKGMLYIGTRSSVKDSDLSRGIEVHIFDFSENIYGHALSIELVRYLRGDEKFDTLEALRLQLYQDQQNTLQVLADADALAADQKAERPAVVVLNYNGIDYLRRFLPSVLANTNLHKYRVVVADNASTDGSMAMLEAEFPQVERLQLTKNLGYAGGYNTALKRIEASYYILLNSDIEVGPNWLEPCLDFLENNPEAAACQPKILSWHDREQFEYAGAAGGWVDALGYPFCRGRVFASTEKDEGQYDDTARVFWASGAALVVRAELYHAIGGFDDAYFAHAEEIDLCWRLQRAGFTIYCVPEAVVYHVGGGTLEYQSTKKTYLNFRNTLITGFKNEPIYQLWWWLPARLVLDGMAGVLFLTQRKFGHIVAIVQAHWHFFSHILYWVRRRREDRKCIQALRKARGASPQFAGQYKGSIVWEYYAMGKRHFSDLEMAASSQNQPSND